MDPLPFRIKIGVTGHRSNLPDTTILKSKLREILGFEEWNKNKTVAPNSLFSLLSEDSIHLLREVKNTKVAFSVMTALAEGADRIVAETVLEFEGAKIEVILPLTKTDYLEDFKTEGSKEEFEYLLQNDLFAISLRSKNISDEYEEGKREVARQRAYFNSGKYIVDNCHLLIIIWNGIVTQGNGGTYEVLEYARKQKRPLIIVDCTNVEIVTLEKGNLIKLLPTDHLCPE